MRSAIKEAKSTIQKAQEDIARYYNQRMTSALVFCPGYQVFLDMSDIKTTCPSAKLLHLDSDPF